MLSINNTANRGGGAAQHHQFKQGSRKGICSLWSGPQPIFPGKRTRGLFSRYWIARAAGRKPARHFLGDLISTIAGISAPTGQPMMDAPKAAGAAGFFFRFPTKSAARLEVRDGCPPFLGPRLAAAEFRCAFFPPAGRPGRRYVQQPGRELDSLGQEWQAPPAGSEMPGLKSECLSTPN